MTNIIEAIKYIFENPYYSDLRKILYKLFLISAFIMGLNIIMEKIFKIKYFNTLKIFRPPIYI